MGIFSDRRTVGALSILAIIVIFFASNILAAATFRHARIDLTEGNLFTLSSGTVNILKSIDEPITITLYYSEKLGTELSEVHTTAERLRDLMLEFVGEANGNLKFDVIGVERYTPSEDEASELGLTGAQTRDGEILYFGLIATNAVDGREVVPFVPLDREQYMEYDLISMIYRLNRINLPVLGLITSLPLDTGPGGMAAAMQGMGRPYVIYDQLLASFEIEHIDVEAAIIPPEVEVLFIAHPDILSRKMLYAIDQFVMKGGRVLALLDPFSEMSQTGDPQMQGRPQATVDSSASTLGPLLASWGVTLDPGFVVADRALGFYVPNSNYPPVLLWPRLEEDNIDRDDIVTGELEVLQFASAGSLRRAEEATTSFTPLVTSSVVSGLVEFQDVKFRKPFDEIIRDFVADDEAHVFSVRLGGKIQTAFPGGMPTEEDYEVATRVENTSRAPHLLSTEVANIIVVADSDFIDDRFWVQVDEFLGERLVRPVTDNGPFVISAVENLMGSNDLISLRTRAGSQRPFTLVEKIQRDAEERYLPKQQELEAKLEEISQRVDELRGTAMTNGQTGQDTIVVTAEQRQELQALLSEHDEKRKEQRRIQFNLRSDIDRLGSQVRFLNIAAMPLIVAAFAIGLAVFRRRRRRLAAGKRV
jgi:gliding motility-associatede transport system auxiliary component